MRSDLPDANRWLGNSRAVIVLAGCAFAVALVLLGYNAGAKYRNRHESSGKNPPPESGADKTQLKWDPALGNVVILPPELGFHVTAPKETGSQAAAIGKRIENQLLGVRQIYRQEVEKNPALMGSVLLQLTVSPAGSVTQVKELTSRLTDNEFKKAVIAEVSQWKFSEISSDPITIYCPLLFVREGMDVRTLIQWEKALGSAESSAPIRKSEGKISQSGSPFSVSARSDPSDAGANRRDSTPQSPATKTTIETYEIKSSATVRKEPTFASISLARVTPGTRVAVVGAHGDWLEIRSKESGQTGFIRKEFVAPINGLRKP
ncbi:MAG TPA: AgmX/PglI C-terminal domain-containing protein [Candidatus Binatia bacterium]|nr:AgmX/PglI C-terminal domain-containing protein [Candidatus Binatia bacterium]